MADKICHYCASPATTKDHIVPKACGGLNVPWNYVPACEGCNKAKAASWPTCTCFKCAYAVGMWHEGNRKAAINKSLKAHVKYRKGAWRVMVPNLPGTAHRSTFRTLKAAHTFATQRLTP